MIVQTFSITTKQQKQVDDWLNTIYKKAVRIQKVETKNPTQMHRFCWSEGIPYCGAIGGGLQYIFTPTSIGVAVTVKETITGETLNITEYDTW